MLLDEVEITSSEWLDGAERQFPPFITQMEVDRRVVDRWLAPGLNQVPLVAQLEKLAASTRLPESNLTTVGASKILSAKIARKPANQ
jgi:hypothetical protein